jgi:chromosome segregation ATPase
MQHRIVDRDRGCIRPRGRRLSCQRIAFLVAFVRVSEPVTKNDLDQAVTTLRAEVGAVEQRLDRRLTSVEQRLSGMEGRLSGVEGRLSGVEGRLSGMEERLTEKFTQLASQIAMQVGNLMVEQLRSQISVVDEKYQDVPAQCKALRRDLDSHVADVHLHRPSPPTPGKRARRS